MGQPPIHKADNLGRPYMRIRFKGIGLRWAIFAGSRPARWSDGKPVRMYISLTREGETTGEMVLADAADVVWEKPAQMDMKYGWFEVAK